MKYSFKNNSFIYLIIFLCIYLTAVPVFGKTTSPSGATRIKAQVNGRLLTISGFIAPYASVGLSSGGRTLRTTVADATGKFRIENVLVWKDFKDFCLDSVDWKRLGESYSCFTVPQTLQNIVFSDILLPPTIGISSKEITQGHDVMIFGFTMPNAVVTIHLNEFETLTVTADSEGYYSYVLKDVKVGTYQLIAGAVYQGKTSVPSLKPVILKAIALTARAIKTVERNWVIIALLTGVVLLITTISFIKWRKQILKRFGIRYGELHHAWFVGY